MANDWRSTTLGDICQLRAGSVFPPALQGKPVGNYPFVKVSDMNLADNAVRIQGANNWINDKDLRQIKAKPFPAGTTVFAKIGEALKANRLRYVIRPTVIDNNMMGAIPASDAVDNRFFYYALSQFDFGEVAGGSALPYLTIEALSKLEIAVPALPEQKAVAHVLGTLDDKIELNRRMNETLEAMAHSMFKAWFVDFEPVRAKMDGRWKRGQSLPGLPAYLYELFPDGFVDSELGEIPEGWRVSTIGKEVTVCGGSTPSTKEPEFWKSGQHCWATPKDLSALKFPVLLDTDRKITDAGLAKISSGLLPVGTVLLSSRAPIGYLAIAEVPTAINQGFIAMKCDGALPNVFVLPWCRESMDAIVGNANGSTFQEISKSNFRPLRVVVPSNPVLASFTRSADSLHRQLAENEREARSLAKLRDTLLPKLISGELRVPDAERIVGAAV